MTSVMDILNTAAQLTVPERAELAEQLLCGLEETHYWVDDEEVSRRARELESGAVEGLSHAEFLKAAGRPAVASCA